MDSQFDSQIDRRRQIDQIDGLTARQLDRQTDRIYIYRQKDRQTTWMDRPIGNQITNRYAKRWLNMRIHQEDQQDVAVKHRHSSHLSLRHRHSNNPTFPIVLLSLKLPPPPCAVLVATRVITHVLSGMSHQVLYMNQTWVFPKIGDPEFSSGCLRKRMVEACKQSSKKNLLSIHLGYTISVQYRIGSCKKSYLNFWGPRHSSRPHFQATRIFDRNVPGPTSKFLNDGTELITSQSCVVA